MGKPRTDLHRTTFGSWALIVCGMVEALWGIGQIYGYLPVKHAMFPLTGSFYNPGPYGGFLAMTFPVCLWEVLNHYRNRRKGLAYWTSLMGLVLIGIMLPATMSRTAWVADSMVPVAVCCSTHRLPNRIYPYYLLVKLYAEKPDVFPYVR